MSYGFSQPQAYNAGNTAPTEISFQIAWTGSLHMELAPAGCQDPQCNADHGYTGDARRGDIAVRVSRPLMAPESVQRAQHFVRCPAPGPHAPPAANQSPPTLTPNPLWHAASRATYDPVPPRGTTHDGSVPHRSAHPA